MSLSMGCVAIGLTSNKQYLGITSTYRINMVVWWPAVKSSSGVNGAGVEMYQGSGAEQAMAKDGVKNKLLPDGITETGANTWVPPKASYLSSWQVAAQNPTDTILQVYGPAGTIVDFHLVGTLQGAMPGWTTGTAFTTTTPSTDVYYMDPDQAGSHVLNVLGLPTIN